MLPLPPLLPCLLPPHLLLIWVGGNWPSISAHSCSPGCCGDGLGRGVQLGQPSLIVVGGLGCCSVRPVSSRGGVTGKSAQPCTERMVALGSRSGDSHSIFLQSQLPLFKCAGLRSHGEGAGPEERAGLWTSQGCNGRASLPAPTPGALVKESSHS